VGGGLSGSAAARSSALLSVASAASAAGAGELQAALTRRAEALQAELDRTVAGECLYCGDVMIYSIAEPLTINSVGAVRAPAAAGEVDDGDDWDV